MPCPVPAARGVDASRSRTLNDLVLEDRPHPSGPGPRRRGLYVDVETTGFDSAHDAIIELGMLPFGYTLEGAITDVYRDQARTWRQDPGRPVPAEITRITGLTDQDLAGEAIDIAAATELVAGAHLVVAHNASFDRPFLEAIVPATRTAAWACSRRKVPWDPAAFPSRALACLLCAYGAFSPDRHRALADCEAGVWLLTQQLPSEERTVFAALRETASTPTIRIWASGAPFDCKDELKHRGYRWMPVDRDRIPRSWWTDVAPADLEAEFAWLGQVYREHGRVLDPAYLPRREVTARDRWRADPLELSA